jgi:hypothetical protein
MKAQFLSNTQTEQPVFTISDFKKLTGVEAAGIRDEITDHLKSSFNCVCIDASLVEEVDLSGINEIIHSNYVLENAGKHLVFKFKKNSIIEKWVATTGLDKFIEISMVVTP